MVEFVLADLGSKDGLTEWVVSNFSKEIDEGYLRLIYTEGMPKFHMALAKNTAHAYSTGEILTSLDADNFTGPRGGKFVYDCFKKHNFETILHQFSGSWRDGTCGRMSYNRKHFIGVGGYDEQLEPFGHDDLDILGRLKAKYSLKVSTGLDSIFRRLYFRKIKKLKSHPRYNRAIESPPTGGEDYRQDMTKRNRVLSDKNIAEGNYQANGGKIGITEGVKLWHRGEYIPCEPTTL